MNSTDLEFVSTEELIAELLKRQTWVGVIIRSTTEADQPTTRHKYFELAWSNMSEEQVCDLLEDTLGKFHRSLQ